MFKINNLKNIKLDEFNISMVPLEVHSYNNGIKKIENFDVPEFIITGIDGENKYNLSFRFNKTLENLYDIELNDFVDINEYNDLHSSYLNVNGYDFDVIIFGKIYRIINRNIVINGLFVIDDILDDEDEDYVGKFEIEFNLDDYIKNDEKSDM